MFFNKKITITLLLTVVTLLGACGSGTNKSSEESQTEVVVDNTRTSDSYILGADVSSLAEFVDNGAIFIDTDGNEKTLLSLLKNHGFNYIRLRTFVDPNAEYGYASGIGEWCETKSESYNDKAHIIEMAQQVKAAGMKLLLDFHYSDTWADPNKQVIPRAWRNINTIEDLAVEVKNYTIDVLTDMKSVGVVPDMVQVGNEITPGMLIHIPTDDTDCYGNNSVESTALNGSAANWENLATLLKAGIKGVKQVNEHTPIMLHIENTGDREGLVYWVNQALEHDVKFDVLGLSAYEKWQGPSTQWQGTLNLLAETYSELSFSIVEYNPQRRLLNDIMFNLPNERGLGTFFWEPVLSGEWGLSMFTKNGNVYTAKPEDFLIYDKIVQDYGLSENHNE
ncbi:glycosyl hydrolase 53 family protein [Pseudoalteromonas sp. SCSIO 43088]|uniref:glycosyl hydrolase 53 family protein n=1 Tax=Pseudoalteromonas sp. SCSIO 43088 TaxID=2822846 RepID=UPI00202B876A|nr:glycosyl hydrolase 53 family protein [Pseudoalteromonas sp. SCSIO 43088]URQ86897.1 glycosyl hydrolase 53 family protein [Pseudoalteromonas sp. SCSIO 43088]